MKTSQRAGLLSLAGLTMAYLLVRAKAAQAEREHPAAGRFVTVDGVSLHYLDEGDGPALVLLHGNGATAEDFRLSGLSAQLAKHFRVIAFDRPGFGYSERPRRTLWTPLAQARLLHQALRQLGVTDYMLLGHSWGALVALAMALEFADKVRGLVLLSGYFYPRWRLGTVAAALPAVPLLGDVWRYTLAPLLGRLAWPAAARFAFSPAKVAATFRRLPPWFHVRPGQLRAAAAEAAMLAPAAARLQPRYAALKMPVSILAGGGDLLAQPRRHSVRLHRALPHSSLRIFPQAGHLLEHLVQDDIAAEALRLAGTAGVLPAPADRQAGGERRKRWRRGYWGDGAMGAPLAKPG